MAKKNFKESDLYTILFATAMVVIVGAGLAALASFTKGDIKKNQRIEKQQNILESIGISKDGMTKGKDGIKEYQQYIKEEITINPNGEVVDGVKAFDVNLANDKENFPLYIADKEGEKLYIIPLYGKGLWNDIWGYMSLKEDLSVYGVVFDHLGETPGLGAEITQDFFEKQFKGEKILNASGEFAGITVLKGNGDPANEDKADNEVDAITGATITCNGVTDMIQKKMAVYVNYLNQ